MRTIAVLFASFLFLPGLARAWVYPEHREIALQSVEALDPERRQIFDELWTEAAADSERLCPSGADREQSTTPDCIDWAAFSAISGDHSCSAADALGIVLHSDWILDVADVSAQLQLDLAEIEVTAPTEQEEEPLGFAADIRRRMESESVRAQRINALRTADTRLQRADPEYATRAGSNNAHFLAPREGVDTSSREYAEATLSEGSETNALGVYSWYHLRALEKAKRLSEGGLTEAQRRTLTRSMLIDEAFGLHFLEDMFAAGHVAGTWGDASQRKGTHDYYNEAGLEAFTWGRGADGVVLMGDAHMRDEDAATAARAISASLRQVLDTARGLDSAPKFEVAEEVPLEPSDFDVCRTNEMPPPPETLFDDSVTDAVGEVLRPTAVPGLGPGLGAMPRFRAEVGPFIGLSAALDGRGLTGGFVDGQSAGAMGGLDISVRAGLGLDGVMGDAGDGLVFIQVGLRADTASSSSLAEAELVDKFGNIGAAIPSRTGLATRFRMPFWLIPGDLLLAAPLFFAAPETYTKMAVIAGNGGLIPWQQGLATPVGRFQLILGREVAVNFYGLLGDNDRLIVAEGARGSGQNAIVDYNSTRVEFPFLEYRPYRAFSSNQSSQIMIQLFGAVDIPSTGRVVDPSGRADLDLEEVWSFGVRFAFDWRYYL